MQPLMVSSEPGASIVRYSAALLVRVVAATDGAAAVASGPNQAGGGSASAGVAPVAQNVPDQEIVGKQRRELQDRINKLKKKSRDVMDHWVEVLSDPVIPVKTSMLTIGLGVLAHEHGLLMQLIRRGAEI